MISDHNQSKTAENVIKLRTKVFPNADARARCASGGTPNGPQAAVEAHFGEVGARQGGDAVARPPRV